MKRFIASLVYVLDRLMPRPRVGGRESSEAYSLWEYRVGKDILDSYGGRLGDLAGKRVLDIGCGLGGKTVAYAEARAIVTGVDISRDNIMRSRAFARARGAEADFAAGDAERLPFADASFDAVIANDSLEHFGDPEAALREIARVLKAGSPVFLFFTPWKSPLGSHLYDYIGTPWCHLIYPEWLIRDLLTRAVAARGVVEPARKAEKLMNEYHAELNRITVKRYAEIVKAISELETVVEERKPAKFRFLKPLLRIPFAGDYLTGTVVAILRRSRFESPTALRSSIHP
jgi:ubiquinone/menaquinone biosynthesis C-methylase UbiE